MASSSDQGLPPRSDEAQLADFRIKNLNTIPGTPFTTSTVHSTPVSRHGVIRGLPKSRYDSLVQDNPHTALTYVDEDDGETITVGSAFELDQRLKDSFNPATASRPVYGASQVHPDDVQLLHTFDLSSRDRSVRQLWQSLQNSKPAPAATLPTTTVPVWARSKPADAKGKAPEYELDRVLRWASDLPAAQDTASTEPIPVDSQPDLTHHSREVQEPQRLLSIHSENNIRSPPAQVAPPATVPVPITVGEPTSGDEHKPLLELFEAELAKLVPDKDATPIVPQSSTSDISPSAQLETTSKSLNTNSATTTTTVDPTAPHIADPDTSVPFAQNVPPTSPAELLTNTLSSLLTGLGNLAARVDESNPQIREQLSHAQSAGQEAAFSLLSRVIPEIQGRAAAAGVGGRPAHSSTTPARPAAPRPAAPKIGSQPATATASAPRNRTYEAERILASRYICYDNLNFGGPRYRQYLVRWAGCGPADDVWYDEDNLRTSCQPLIDLYERTRSQTPMQAQDAAQLHRRTAGNRMMASVVAREQHTIADVNALSPIQTTVSHNQPDPAQRQCARNSTSPKVSPVADRRAYTFDPSEVMTHPAPLPLGGESDALARPTEEPPLRRARSLAFRNVPGSVLRTSGRLHGQALDSAADILSQKAIPTLRRAATTIHRHADSRARGCGDAADALFNSFEASRGRYLPRRAATTRSAFRNGEHRTDASPQSDKITRCAEDLVKMGYRRSEAEPVAAICDGDLSKALDQLEEDRKAWLWRSNNDTQTAPSDAAAGNMPGSWDVYRW